jgi:hypothetical protein
MTIIYDDTNDETLSRIEAMCQQEDDVTACYNYLQHSHKDIDENCRTSMVTWCQQVQKALKLSPETVSITISFFDRYLSSGKGKCHEALQDKYKFQLAMITSFYISVKLYESVQLNADTLVKLCKGYYAKADILDVEEDILFALDFRLATPTPMEFVRHFVRLLPPEINTESLLKACSKRIEYSTSDFYFTFCKPSVVGASCLASILTGRDLLSPTERQTFYFQLANICDLIDVMEAQNKLLTGHTKPVSVSKFTKKSNIVSKVAGHYVNKKANGTNGDKSPVCITQSIASPVCISQAPRAA